MRARDEETSALSAMRAEMSAEMDAKLAALAAEKPIDGLLTELRFACDIAAVRIDEMLGTDVLGYLRPERAV